MKKKPKKENETTFQENKKTERIKIVDGINYFGPPELKPITSYENAFIVRSMFKISKFLEERFGKKYNLRPLGEYGNILTAFFVIFIIYLFANILS